MQSNGSILDYEQLRELREVAFEGPDADKEFRELVELFMEESSKKFRELEAMGKTAEGEKVWNHLHTMKGSASNVGATAFADICHLMENFVKQGKTLGEMPVEMGTLRALQISTTEALKRELETGK